MNMNNSEGMSKICPRCSIAFTCNRNNINNCQCYELPMNEQEISALSKFFSDCLCRKCLKTLPESNGNIIDKKDSLPT